MLVHYRFGAAATAGTLALVLMCDFEISTRYATLAKYDPRVEMPSEPGIGAFARYRLDPKQSRFYVKAFAGGLFSVFAHDHNIAIRDFDGHADFTYGTVEPASLEITVKASSLEVTDNVSAGDRQKIESTMRGEVLETSKYPEMVFRSDSISATKTNEGSYRANISGELSLHGVTKPLNINARLEFGDQILRARGTFSIKQTSFNIKPPSVGAGTIKVKDELKFTFDVIARP